MTSAVEWNQEWFSGKYIPEPNSGCWLWLGELDSGGYGVAKRRVGKGRKTTRAHHIAMRLSGLDIKSDQVVRHKCDNPPCVNPDHLEVGTQGDNIHDAIRKGRNSKGPTHSAALVARDWYEPNTVRGADHYLFGKRQSFCRNGHEMTAENLVPTKNGYHSCKICRRIRVEASRDKRGSVTIREAKS